MPEITEDLIRAAVDEFIVRRASGEKLNVFTEVEHDERWAGGDQTETAVRIIDAIGKATVTVSWPDRLPAVADHEAALLDILASAGDGGTYVEKCVGDFDRTHMCSAEDTDLPDRLLAWHRGGVQAVETERDKLGGQLAQLRHIIDAQAHRIQGGLDRIAELEALLVKAGNRKPGCDHGPDMQCVACVPDDGFSHRPPHPTYEPVAMILGGLLLAPGAAGTETTEGSPS